MTYDQYRTILAALEARKQATERTLRRKPLQAAALLREKDTDAAIAALRAAFNQAPSVVLVRAS